MALFHGASECKLCPPAHCRWLRVCILVVCLSSLHPGSSQAMTLHPMGATASQASGHPTSEGSLRSMVSNVASKITSMFSGDSGGGGGGASASKAESVAAAQSQLAQSQRANPESADKSQKLFAKILFFRARVLLARKYVKAGCTCLIPPSTPSCYSHQMSAACRKFQRATTFAEKALALDPASRYVSTIHVHTYVHTSHTSIALLLDRSWFVCVRLFCFLTHHMPFVLVFVDLCANLSTLLCLGRKPCTTRPIDDWRSK